MSQKKNNGYQFKNDIKRIDEIVNKMINGVMPMVDEFTMKEAEIRMRQILDDRGESDDDDEVDLVDLIKETEQIKTKIEDEQRKARREDIARYTLTNEEQASLMEDMKSSFVRKRPSSYNIDSDIRDRNDEVRILRKKLSKLRREYYRVEPWREAVKTVLEVFRYAKDHEYPWLSEQEFISMFKEGNIVLNVVFPILNKDYNTPIKDPEILMGLFTGEIQAVDDEDDDDDIVFDKRSVEWVRDDEYGIISSSQYDRYQNMAANGWCTPIDAMLTQKQSNLYERFLPATKKEIESTKIRDFFSYKKSMKMTANGKLKPYSATDIMNSVIRKNGNTMNTSITNNANKLLAALGNTEAKVVSTYSSNDNVKNLESLKKEAALFAAIKKTNKNTY